MSAAKPSQRIKIGQIGTAHAHAKGKMETLRRLTGEFEIVGVVEPDQERRKEAESKPEYKHLKWLSEEQLLNTTGLQAVAVETLERELVPVSMRCVNAGMHVHVDKPPGESLSALRSLLEQATQRNLTIQMGYMFRYNPAFKFCFKAVREGWLGDIFEIHGVISKTLGSKRRKQWATYPGGTMFVLGSHLIDALIAVMGRPDKVTPFIRHTRPHKDNLADNQLAVFEYPKATATIRSAVMEVEGSDRRQFVVCGDKGTVDIRPLEPPKLRLALDSPRGKYKEGYQDVSLPAMPGRYDEQLIDFARTIRGEQEPAYEPSHDLTVHESLLQACGLPLD